MEFINSNIIDIIAIAISLALVALLVAFRRSSKNDMKKLRRVIYKRIEKIRQPQDDPRSEEELQELLTEQRRADRRLTAMTDTVTKLEQGQSGLATREWVGRTCLSSDVEVRIDSLHHNQNKMGKRLSSMENSQPIDEGTALNRLGLFDVLEDIVKAMEAPLKESANELKRSRAPFEAQLKRLEAAKESAQLTLDDCYSSLLPEEVSDEELDAVVEGVNGRVQQMKLITTYLEQRDELRRNGQMRLTRAEEQLNSAVRSHEEFVASNQYDELAQKYELIQSRLATIDDIKMKLRRTGNQFSQSSTAIPTRTTHQGRPAIPPPVPPPTYNKSATMPLDELDVVESIDLTTTGPPIPPSDDRWDGGKTIPFNPPPTRMPPSLGGHTTMPLDESGRAAVKAESSGSYPTGAYDPTSDDSDEIAAYMRGDDLPE